MTEALRDIIDATMPCVASIVEATEPRPPPRGAAAEAEGEEGVAAPLPPPWGQTDDGVGGGGEGARKARRDEALGTPAPRRGRRRGGAPARAADRRRDGGAGAALAKSLAAAPTMLEGAADGLEVTRILEAAQGEVLEAKGARGGRRLPAAARSTCSTTARPTTVFSPTSTRRVGRVGMPAAALPATVSTRRAPRAASRRGWRRAGGGAPAAPPRRRRPSPRRRKGRSDVRTRYKALLSKASVD